MEMVSVYLYNHVPVETNDFSNRTFHNLKRNGWYNDTRSNNKFTILNKRIQVRDKWYRIVIRFKYKGLTHIGKESYELSNPVPFLVTECEPLADGNRWKDVKTYHGRNIESISAFLEASEAPEVIEEIYQDLKQHAVYN